MGVCPQKYDSEPPPDLSVAVLSGLGSGHLNNFAGTILQDHEAVFAQGAALLRVRHRGPGVSTGEIKIWICHGGI